MGTETKLPAANIIFNIYHIDRSVFLENTPTHKIHTKLHLGSKWQIFHILTVFYSHLYQ